MDSKNTHPLTWLAVALGAVAVVAVVVVGGLLYGVRWLVSQPMAFNNPAYMAVIVAGALIVGFGMGSGSATIHDLVDAVGDWLKTRKDDPPPIDLDAQHRMAQTAERMAMARKLDRDGLPPPRPSYADDPASPWPAEESVNGNGTPQEWRG